MEGIWASSMSPSRGMATLAAAESPWVSVAETATPFSLIPTSSMGVYSWLGSPGATLGS